ncbi:MAG: DUF975 family protein [Oscillospiraceae bacterium]|nr:DUF975 family protein [Oscillospiraceae bacterium]
MGYDHQRVKSNAKLFYKNNTGSSILAVLMFFGIFAASMVLVRLFNLFGAFLALVLGVSVGDGYGQSAGWVFFLLTIIFVYISATVIDIVVWEGFCVLAMGVMDWFRRSIREKISLKEAFRPFGRGRFWGSIGTCVLMQLYTFLWSLLFIVPGIIKSYSYSMTMYIKAENPEIAPSRAIELSMLMTDGHKGDLFYLHLSFLGWFLLSSLTYNILGIVYVFPYFYAAKSFAYEELKADAAARGIIDIREISLYAY